MIKLVTSDIDGTLLLDGAWELDGTIFPLIRRLKEHGIAFAAASGRQHHRLRAMFEEVASDIFFICENGAVVFEGDTLLSQTPLPQDKAHELIAEILAVPELEVLISGAESCYLIPKTDDYVHLIRDQVKYRTKLVSCIEEIPETIIKVSAYRKDGAAVLTERFAPKWGDVFQMAIAGLEWLDFTLSDKGTGLGDICKRLGISEKEVMSFGDNFNDLPLLSRAGVPYIMDGAPDELKGKFPRRCSRVEDTLTAFLDELDHSL
ncbi:MAG: HAD family phosphatase [Clostridia bacterium]|nr:HAD family phosphatase [Clostridia bacterium]